METIFGRRVREQMRAVGMTQDKELAIVLAEAGGKIPTAISKLSKALSGVEEGLTWLLRENRLAHLADTLQVSLETILTWKRESDAAPTLVLDPGLPEAAIEHIRDWGGDGERYVVVDPGPLDDETPEAVRNQLKAVATELPNALVVIRDELLDESFFLGAGLAVSTIRQVVLGWKLRERPDLLPLREPPPAQLEDEKGRPLFPSEPFTKALEQRRDGYLWERHKTQVEEARATGATASFPLEDILPFLIARALDPETDSPIHPNDLPRYDVELVELNWQPTHPGRRIDLPDPASASKEIVEQLEQATKTIVWRHQRRYFVVGKAVTELQGLFAPHHSDWGPFAFDVPESLVRSLETRNLWKADGLHWWEEARSSVLENTAVDIGSMLPGWQLTRLEQPPNLVTERLASDEDKRVRANLSSIAERAVKGESTLPWLLAQLAAAPLLGRTTAPTEDCHVIGYLGHGRMAEVRLFRFEGEQAAELEPVQGHEAPTSWRDRERESVDWYDGGDLRLRVRTWKNDHLGPRLH